MRKGLQGKSDCLVEFGKCSCDDQASQAKEIRHSPDTLEHPRAKDGLDRRLAYQAAEQSTSRLNNDDPGRCSVPDCRSTTTLREASRESERQSTARRRTHRPMVQNLRGKYQSQNVAGYSPTQSVGKNKSLVCVERLTGNIPP